MTDSLETDISIDSEWYYGPKYIEIVLLPKEDLEYPIREKHATIYASWNFKESKYFTWLEANCSGRYCYELGEELNNEQMMVYIGFLEKKCVEAFKAAFEVCNWNFAIDYNTIDKSFWYHNISFDPFLLSIEECDEKMQWCRENIQDYWTYVLDGENLTFYFVDEKDAMAFKLKWL